MTEPTSRNASGDLIVAVVRHGIRATGVCAVAAGCLGSEDD
jgi:hypothetical protein